MRYRGFGVVLCVLALAADAAGALAQTGETLASVRTRGAISCGVGDGLPGFSAPDSTGSWRGFDVDFCRALAAAVFGDPGKVSFRPLPSKEALIALRTGEIDVLARGPSWTLDLEAGQHMRFVGTSYFGGIGLMVRKDLGVASALELSGSKICAYNGLLADEELSGYFATRHMPVDIIPFERAEDALKAYDNKQCGVFAASLSTINGERSKLSVPAEHTVLPETISNEPAGPIVRQGDDHWFTLVRWTLFALVRGEELGISSANADAAASSGSLAAKRLLGGDTAIDASLGIDTKWAYSVLKFVGNYGEVFNRNLGADSKLGLERGLNNLWSAGGLMYAPPLR